MQEMLAVPYCLPYCSSNNNRMRERKVTNANFSYQVTLVSLVLFTVCMVVYCY